VNLKELSHHLGLSQTTVSRALNGYPEVSEDTRRRVFDAARHLNYQPNSNARRLATGKTSTIGHVVPLSVHDVINPHFSDFIAGASEIYNQRGYDMILSVVDPEAEAATYANLYRDQRVDGVIVNVPKLEDQRISLLREMKLPFVVHGRTQDPDDSYCWVDVDNRESFEQATDFLLDRGHTRIGLINGWEFMSFAARRRQGFEAALRARGIEPDPDLMTSEEMIEPNGHAAMSRLLDFPQPPTAVLCSSILTAMGAMRAIGERGLTAGKDISLIGYDDCLSFLPSASESRSMTVIRSSIRLAGRNCASILIDQIEQKNGPESLLMETELVVGATT
jgi:LacI family transcriptional regulator